MKALVLAVLIQAARAQGVDFYQEGAKALDAQKYDAAVDFFAKAIAADPQDYAAHFNRGLAFTYLNRETDAIAEYRRVLEIKPDVFEAELNLATSLLKMNQFAVAEQMYSKALALKPDSQAAESGLGRTLAREGKLSEADPHYRKAGEVKELAAEYELAKKPQEAIAIYKTFPEDPAAQERMGALLIEIGNPQDAIAPLELAVGKSPTAANRLALAEAYARTKQDAKAEPLVAAALAAAPGDIELRMFYAKLLRDERKFPEAAGQFQAAAKAKPDMADAWTELAGVLIMMDQYPPALAALDRVHALNAETAGHYFLRGMVLDKLHQPKDAMANYNQFLALSQGKNPDQEFQARQRVKTLEHEVKR